MVRVVLLFEQPFFRTTCDTTIRISLGWHIICDIDDIGQSQCHNPYERERKKANIVVDQYHQFYITQVLSIKI